MTNPLKREKWVYSCDSESFKYLSQSSIAIPYGDHPGAFWCKRKNHYHEGVDLYGQEGDLVYAIESGVVVDVIPFTGVDAESPWWNNTSAVIVKGDSGYILYGEVEAYVSEGDTVCEGEVLASLVEVLKKDKGRPTTMLHLEWYKEWSGKPYIGSLNNKKPHFLLDPTDLLNSTDVYNGSTIIVCGTWDKNGGKRSGFMDKALKNYYETLVDCSPFVTVHNGGNIDNLGSVLSGCTSHKNILWFIDVDNSERKNLPNVCGDKHLSISKNNRDMSYTEVDLKDRMQNAEAKNLVEFNKQDGKIRWRIHNNSKTTRWNYKPDGLIRSLIC